MSGWLSAGSAYYCVARTLKRFEENALPSPAQRVVRARQRDRANSLPGFDRDFAPQPHEWGIDKLMLSVSGAWRTQLADGREYFRQRLTDPSAPFRWLNRVVEQQGAITVQTLRPLPLTIGRIAVRASRCMTQNGRVTVDIVANPTRTLAALLVRLGGGADFRFRIFRMEAFDFFASPNAEQSLPPSLDGGDNYLPEHPGARDALGPDPFSTFMPIYLAHLRELVARILAEHTVEMRVEGSEQVFSSDDGSMRLDWGEAKVPQIETYFERFHRHAQAAVRTAGSAVIDGDTNVVLRLHNARSVVPYVERSGDRFAVAASINLGLDNRHDLVVYAKTERRIRFEVRRSRRGRYDSVPETERVATRNAVDERLLRIMLDVERHDAERLVRWRDLFEAFDEPDTPGIGDLAALITAISSASGSGEVFRLILNRIVVDGGISAGTDARVPNEVLARLVRVGVLERARIRTRRPNSQLDRYRLTGMYRSLHQQLIAALRIEPEPAPASLE